MYKQKHDLFEFMSSFKAGNGLIIPTEICCENNNNNIKLGKEMSVDII